MHVYAVFVEIKKQRDAGRPQVFSLLRQRNSLSAKSSSRCSSYSSFYTFTIGHPVGNSQITSYGNIHPYLCTRLQTIGYTYVYGLLERDQLPLAFTLENSMAEVRSRRSSSSSRQKSRAAVAREKCSRKKAAKE